MVDLQADLQHFLLFAAVYREHLMTRHSRYCLREIVIYAINAVLLRGGDGADKPVLFYKLPQPLAELGVVRKPLRDDIRSSLKRVVYCFNALLRVDIVLSKLGRGEAVALLGKNEVRKRLKPLLLCHGRSRPPLLLIRAVQIFKLGKRLGGHYLSPQLVCKLALLLNGAEHGLPALIKPAQILKPRLKRPQRGVVHRAVQLLAVARDKGNCVSFVQKCYYVFYVLLALAELGREKLYDFVHCYLRQALCFFDYPRHYSILRL